MLGFASDYMEGAHDKILQRLVDINYVHNTGYGSDYYCRKAAQKIRRACGSEDVEVEVLPYHTMGIAKWEALGWAYPLQSVPEPTKEEVTAFRQALKQAGIKLAATEK